MTTSNHSQCNLKVEVETFPSFFISLSLVQDDRVDSVLVMVVVVFEVVKEELLVEMVD